MKRLFLCLSAAAICLAGCEKDEPGKQIIENQSGFEWNDTQIWIRSSEGNRQESVGRVAQGASAVVYSPDGRFSVSTRDAAGKQRSSKMMPFAESGTTTVKAADFLK